MIAIRVCIFRSKEWIGIHRWPARPWDSPTWSTLDKTIAYQLLCLPSSQFNRSHLFFRPLGLLELPWVRAARIWRLHKPQRLHTHNFLWQSAINHRVATRLWPGLAQAHSYSALVIYHYLWLKSCIHRCSRQYWDKATHGYSYLENYPLYCKMACMANCHHDSETSC